MFIKLFKAVFVVFLVTALSSAALAFQPQDALSARPVESFYTVLCIDDLNGLLQNVFSPANIEMVKSLVEPEQVELVALVADFATQLSAKSLLVAVGMADMGPFMQTAVLMPAAVRPKLDKVADGSATGIDIVTLLLGENGAVFADMFEPDVQNGAKGPYYSLMGMVAIAAKGDLLLIASSQAELEASLDALEKKENRLSFKRRFDSPNYLLMYMDTPTVVALAEMFGGEDVPASALTKFFKAPLELEYGFEPKQGSFLLSGAVNLLDSLADSARYKDMKPVKGANLFLAGGGKLLLAFSSPQAFKSADLKALPEFAEGWNKLIEELEKMEITEGDVEDLLNGSLTIVLGSEATIMGASVPGGYITLTGRKGIAAKILGKLMENEELTQMLPMAPLKVDGWELAFAADPETSPVPLVLGVTKDTLFVGLINSGALVKKPELPDEISKMLNDSLLGVGVIDTAGIWNLLKKEIADPNSLLSAAIEGDVKDIVNDVLGADISVPLIKIWYPELETAFMEFSVVDVPLEKRILPRLLKVAQMFFVTSQDEDEDEDEDIEE